MGSLDKSSGSESEVITIDVHQVKNLIDSGYGYLDVRTVEEYRKGHVSAEKIFNIPYTFNTPEGRVKNPEFLKEVSSVCKKDDLLVVGCQSGMRSLYATADLLKTGFKNVSNVGGGYLAWVGNGFPLEMEEIPIPVPVKLEEKPKQEMKEIPVPANVEEKPKQENDEIPVPVKVEENPKQENGEIPVPVMLEENPKQEL